MNAISKFDIDRLELILDENKKYDGLEKREYLQFLREAFGKMKTLGDTYLETHKGHCILCTNGLQGFTFVGNCSRQYFSLVFKQKQGVMFDMYQCTKFKNKKREFEKSAEMEIVPDTESKLPLVILKILAEFDRDGFYEELERELEAYDSPEKESEE